MNTDHLSLRAAAVLGLAALHECIVPRGAETQIADAMRALGSALAADPVVGHKTIAMPGGGHRHEPLSQSEASALMVAVEEGKRRRAELMPTEEAAARMLFEAWYRLKELGWRETCHGPTGVTVKVVEPGSAGIHEAVRHDPWPEKTWWIDGDAPSNPCLFRLIPTTDGGAS